MKEIKISIQNAFNEKLVGIETIPLIKKEKFPTVILVHGFGVTKEEGGMFDKLAKNFSNIGFWFIGLIFLAVEKATAIIVKHLYLN